MKYYRDLFKSFGYAFSGLFSAIRTERNMRIHLSCMVYMFAILGFTDWFKLTKGEWGILILACGMVISAELINTAVENAINLETTEINPLAKTAKDTAAGAVLICAIAAVATGIVILLQPEAFKAMYYYFADYPIWFAALILSLIPTTLFIFLGLPEKRKK